MTHTQSLPQRKGKSQLFWESIREILEKSPNEVILVTTYNHPTIAYRARRDINSGLNAVFPELGQWNAIVVKDENSRFIAARSRKWTYKYRVYMVYTPKENS